MRFVNALAIALSMYSKIPVPTVDWNDKNMKYAMCFFPWSGVVTGLLQFGAGYALLTYTSCGETAIRGVMTLIPCWSREASIWTVMRTPSTLSVPGATGRRNWRS